MPIVKANTINIYYEQHGSGPHLILIAGYTADHRTWHNVIAPLARDFTVTVFDNRGTGQTNSPDEPYSMKMLANDLIGLMDALKINKAFVLGHSMGGFILQELLAHYPDRFTKGILVASRLLPAPAYLLHAEINSELIAAGVAIELVAKNAATFLFGDDYLNSNENITAFVELIVNNPYPPSMIGLNRQAQASAQFDKLALLDQIKTPLLAIYGNNDLIAPIKMLEPLRQKLPDISVKILDNCGHMPHFEKPEAFVAAIKRFLLPS